MIIESSQMREDVNQNRETQHTREETEERHRRSRQGAVPSHIPSEEEEQAMEAERELDQRMRQKVRSFLVTEYARLSLYALLTFFAGYLIVKVGDQLPGMISAVGKGLAGIGSLLTPLFLGFVIAYLLYPVVRCVMHLLEKLQEKAGGQGRRGSVRTAAVVVTMAAAVGVILIAVSLAFSSVTHQLRMVSLEDLSEFVTGLADSINEMYRTLQRRLNELNYSSEELETFVQNVSIWLGGLAGEIGNMLTSSLSSIPSMMSTLLFAIVFAIYFLIDAEGLSAYWDRIFKAVTSHRFYYMVHRGLDDADIVFAGYIRGQMIDAVIMFAMVSVALSLLGVRFAVIIGILTGFGNLIPYVGPIIAYGSTVAVCVLNGDWQKLVISIVVLFIIQTIDGNVINPKLLSSSIDVHPMLVIVALIIGGAGGGILGMLVAVPIAALLKIWFDRFIDRLERKKKTRLLYGRADEGGRGTDDEKQE